MRQVFKIRRAPGVAATTPVRVLGGIDENDAGGTEQLHGRGAIGVDHAVLDDDLAFEVGRAGHGIEIVAEHLRVRRVPARRRVDRLLDKHERRAHAVRHRLAHGRRPGKHFPATGFDVRTLGQREIEIRLVDCHRHAQCLQPIDHMLRRAVAVVRMLAADGGEQLDQRPRVVEPRAASSAFSSSVTWRPFPLSRRS